MSQILKKYPVPIVGLMLGLASAGNLVQSYGEVYHSALGIISAILLILMIAKIAKYPKDVVSNLDNPVVASVFPAFSMSIMLLSTYVKPYSVSLAFTIWIIGIALHITLIL